AASLRAAASGGETLLVRGAPPDPRCLPHRLLARLRHDHARCCPARLRRDVAREAESERGPVTEVRAPAAAGHPEEATGEPGLQAPGPAPRGRRPAPAGPFGMLQWARWGWRQLTSMRTALILLFL